MESLEEGYQIEFSYVLDDDTPSGPITIIGTWDALNKLSFSIIAPKCGENVTEEVYRRALHISRNADSCPLYTKNMTMCVIPDPEKVSRHNTDTNAHAITKFAKSIRIPPGESHYCIMMVCKISQVFASACALAKAFPMYTRKGNRKRPKITIEYHITGDDGNEKVVLTREEVKLLEDAAFAVRNAARIVDMPCLEMNTDRFIKECQIIAAELGIIPTIIRGEELRERGMGGIYSVGKAAEFPPALVCLSHRPESATKTIAWVGKGIMFDTGGLSIKGKTAMCGMKRDCGGAAGILNAFYLAVKAGFTENLVAILCIAENAVGPLATRPDDIIEMYSKKTVEINNTDAEGRLVLSDGVVYAKNDCKADIIVDMATLTSAQGITTGKYHAGIMTNCEAMESAAVIAGRNSGDLTFPMVFAPELHFEEFKSAIADMKNSVADRTNALASCAGLFIYSHLGFDFPGVWLHVDMAAPVVDSGERATGYGVALLNTLFGNYSQSSLLNSLSPWNGKEKMESD